MPLKTKTYEESCYKVKLQRKEFDPQTGKEKFAPFEQYFTPDEFKRLKANPNGYSILEVLYDPTAKVEEEKPTRSRKS